MVKKEAAPGDGQLANNRKALHDYMVLDQVEAGIQLVGTEVKSCRARSIALNDAYVDIIDGTAWLINLHIAGYDYGNRFNHDAKRRRRLLLHKSEILKLALKIRDKGITVIPLRFYLKHGLVKVALGLCRGKSFGDKRETLRERQDLLDTKRAIRGERL